MSDWTAVVHTVLLHKTKPRNNRKSPKAMTSQKKEASERFDTQPGKEAWRLTSYMATFDKHLCWRSEVCQPAWASCLVGRTSGHFAWLELLSPPARENSAAGGRGRWVCVSGRWGSFSQPPAFRDRGTRTGRAAPSCFFWRSCAEAAVLSLLPKEGSKV